MINELEHFYMDNCLDVDKLYKNNSYIKNKNANNVLLLDDIHINNYQNNMDLSYLKEQLKTVYQTNVHIYFESEMIDYAELTLNLLQKNKNFYLKDYFFKNQQKHVVFIQTKSDKSFKIALYEYDVKNKTVNYYCVLLSLTWLLSKLFNFNYKELEMYSKTSQFAELQNLNNYLEDKYKKVEENVLILLGIIDKRFIPYVNNIFITY